MIKEPVIYSEEELLRVWRLLDEERQARLTHIINFDYQQQRSKTRGKITVILNEEAELEHTPARRQAKKKLRVIQGGEEDGTK